MFTLQFRNREKKENVNALREGGFVPAVYYGKKTKAVSISVSLEAFKKVWKSAGETGVITLKNEKDEVDALIYEVDLDPIKDVPRHIDFYVFEKGQKLKVKVPVEFVGIAPAVKDLGGVLVKVMHEVEVEAEPKNLPRSLEADISTLVDFKSQILVMNIKLPAGVSLISGLEEVVASVYEPKEEVVEEVPVDLSAIEVEKKGKQEEQGAIEGGVSAGGETAPKPENK